MEETLRKIREVRAAERQAGTEAAKHQSDMDQQFFAMAELQKSVIASAKAIISAVTMTESTVKVKNFPEFPDSIKTPDVAEVTEAIKGLETTLKPLTPEPLDLSKMEAELSSISQLLVALPENMPDVPDYPESVEVSNLSELVSKFEVMIKLFRELKLDPTIQVAPAEVVVEAPDFSRLEAGIKDLLTAFNNIKIPETNTSKLEKQLIETNKKLEELVNKKWGGGGSGGGDVSYQDTEGRSVRVTLTADGAVPVSIESGTTGGSDNSELVSLTAEVLDAINSLKFLSSLQTPTSELRVRPTGGALDTLTTLTTLTTLATLTNQTNIGGYNAAHTVMAQMNTNAYQLRDRITVT